MPPKKTRRNDKWLTILEDLHAELEDGNKMVYVYGKAIKSLKQETIDHPDVESIRRTKVKFIGTALLTKLENGARGGDDDEPGSSQPRRKRKSDPAPEAPKKRGRPPKKPSEDAFHDYIPDFSEAAPLNRGYLQNTPSSSQTSSDPNTPSVSMPRYSFDNSAGISDANRASGFSSQTAVPTPTPNAEFSPLQFFYLDENNVTIRNSEDARVDIARDSLWFKVRFSTDNLSVRHPIMPCLRPKPTLDFNEASILDAWLEDRAVEAFNLHIAPGIPRAVQGPTQTAASTSNSQPAASASKGQPSTSSSNAVQQAALKGKAKAPVNATSHDPYNLAAALRGEAQRKKMTLDPSRTATTSSLQWEVRNGQRAVTQPNAKPAAAANGTCETAGSSSNLSASTSMAQPASSSTSVHTHVRAPAPAPPPARPQLHKATTLPEGALDGPSRPRSIRELPQYDPPPPPPLPSSQPTIAETVQPTRAQKGKRLVTRGRVSEFAVPLPAVDDFDRDLDRQAMSQDRQARTGTTSSYVSADMMNEVADLTTASAVYPTFEPIIFPADSYEIIMILDNREVTSHKNRGYMPNTLQAKGVNVEQRPLAVGDALWIARGRIMNPVTREIEVQECVVDYILERKRLDDLLGSLRDGRFHEQKYRLANTGLKVFYLVEEYSVKVNKTMEKAVNTVKSSTQIIDGFHLKETPNVEYTLDFLGTMHKTICSMYKGKPLYLIPPEHVKRHSYMGLQKYLRDTQPHIRYMTTYTSFDALNNKSKNLTSRDIFSHMLLCIRGVSAEKATAITKYYPTHRSLWDAFREAEGEEREQRYRLGDNIGTGRGKARVRVTEARHLLTRLGNSNRQKIGEKLSQDIYELFMKKRY